MRLRDRLMERNVPSVAYAPRCCASAVNGELRKVARHGCPAPDQDLVTSTMCRSSGAARLNEANDLALIPARNPLPGWIVMPVQNFLVRNIYPGVRHTAPARKFAADERLEVIAVDAVLHGSAVGHIAAGPVGSGLIQALKPWGQCRIGALRRGGLSRHRAADRTCHRDPAIIQDSHAIAPPGPASVRPAARVTTGPPRRSDWPKCSATSWAIVNFRRSHRRHESLRTPIQPERDRRRCESRDQTTSWSQVSQIALSGNADRSFLRAGLLLPSAFRRSAQGCSRSR